MFVEESPANRIPPPVDRNLEPGRPAASWDVAPSEDKLTTSLSSVVTALQTLVEGPPENLEHTRLSALVGTALKKLRAARADSETLTTSREADVYERLAAELSRLRSLLVAVSHDQAIVQRITAPSAQLAAAIDRLIERSASARIRVEKQSLEAVFSSVEDVFVSNIPDEHPFPSSIQGHRWIVGVAPAAWDDAVTAATTLDRSVVAVPVTLVGVTDDMALPIALGVPWSKDRFMIVPPEEISEIADKLNRRTLPSMARQLFSDVLDEVVLASWKVARRRLRSPEWAAEEDSTPQEHLERARQQMREGGKYPKLVAILATLTDRVEQEMLQGDKRPIAAAVAVPRLLAVEDVDGDDVTELLESGTLLALAEELATCVATTNGGLPSRPGPQ